MLLSDFYNKVFELVRMIPEGRVSTYGNIALALGSKRAARTVGYALNTIKNGKLGRKKVPAHRVVNRNGELTGKIHFRDPNLMRELLESEKIHFVGERVNMAKHLWVPPFYCEFRYELKK